MVAVLAFLIFAAAFAAAMSVFTLTLVPALPRIAALLRGEADPARVTEPMLILSDRRLRARVRPLPVTAAGRQPLRAAA